MDSNEYYMADDCPQCGLKDSLNAWSGARMGSTVWGHDYMCCSHECGLLYKDNPKRLERDREAIRFKISVLKQQLKNLK